MGHFGPYLKHSHFFPSLLYSPRKTSGRRQLRPPKHSCPHSQSSTMGEKTSEPSLIYWEKNFTNKKQQVCFRVHMALRHERLRESLETPPSICLG